MTDVRFDVVYTGDGASITPHFCRQWDEDGGCYGTNPNHGFSFEDACDLVAEHYDRLAKTWRDRTNYDAQYYLKGAE